MKYNISKQFGIFRFVKLPLNKFTMVGGKILLSLMPKGMLSNKKLKIQKFKVTSRDGKKITNYLISPKNATKKLPLIVNIHGGGFVFKAGPHQYSLAKKYALSTNSNVLFIDYRLAYNTKFETGLNDCEDVYKYVLNNADSFNIDLNNVGFLGDSAGGFLTLSLTKRCYNNGLQMPKFQFLIYPVVDPTMSTESMKTFVDTPMWNAKCSKKMWEIYKQGNIVDTFLNSENTHFMPKTYVETAEFDCLHDEAVMLYEGLQAKKIESILYETKQTMHGFDMCGGAKITKEVVKNRIEYLGNFINE